MGQVSRPARLVVPVSLYVGLSQLHTVLRKYKDSPIDAIRNRCQAQVAALITRFLRDHSACIEEAGGSSWDLVTTIPSSQGRLGPHPLEEAIAMSPALRSTFNRTLEPGQTQLRHLAASDGGFHVIADVNGRSILIIDDTFTSGARCQSAASALQLAGAHVVAVVPVGRFIRPEFSDEASALWNDAYALPFRFDSCCLE